MSAGINFGSKEVVLYEQFTDGQEMVSHSQTVV